MSQQQKKMSSGDSYNSYSDDSATELGNVNRMGSGHVLHDTDEEEDEDNQFNQNHN